MTHWSQSQREFCLEKKGSKIWVSTLPYLVLLSQNSLALFLHYLLQTDPIISFAWSMWKEIYLNWRISVNCFLGQMLNISHINHLNPDFVT